MSLQKLVVLGLQWLFKGLGFRFCRRYDVAHTHFDLFCDGKRLQRKMNSILLDKSRQLQWAMTKKWLKQLHKTPFTEEWMGKCTFTYFLFSRFMQRSPQRQDVYLTVATNEHIISRHMLSIPCTLGCWTEGSTPPTAFISRNTSGLSLVSAHTSENCCCASEADEETASTHYSPSMLSLYMAFQQWRRCLVFISATVEKSR